MAFFLSCICNLGNWVHKIEKTINIKKWRAKWLSQNIMTCASWYMTFRSVSRIFNSIVLLGLSPFLRLALSVDASCLASFTFFLSDFAQQLSKWVKDYKIPTLTLRWILWYLSLIQYILLDKTEKRRTLCKCFRNSKQIKKPNSIKFSIDNIQDTIL